MNLIKFRTGCQLRFTWFSQNRQTLNANAAKRTKGANFLMGFREIGSICVIRVEATLHNAQLVKR